MSDLSNYPEEHPETGKVKNPLTGNWVKQSYAKSEGILEQAKQHTQQHFKEEQSGGGEADEIDRLLKEVEETEPGEAFDLTEEELERLDEHAEIDHAEIPDSGFPNEEDFAPGSEEEDGFEQPPTPEGLDQAAQTQQNSGEYQGIYSGQKASGRQRQKDARDKAEEMERKHEEDEVRYVKTEQGGMKMVYPNEDNDQ